MIPTAGSARREARLGKACLALVCLLSGCPGPQADPAPPPARPPFAGRQVRLLVVDDPQLAASIARLTGEWKARSGASVELAEATSADVESRDTLDADAVIYPAGQLGLLAERGWLRPLTEQELAVEEIGWSDILPALRDHELAWGGEPHALPLGSPVLVCHYRVDLLERFGQKPPQTWAEYQELAEFFAIRAPTFAIEVPQGVEWCGAAEPLAPGWAGLTLLARAAAYARHPYYHSTVFDLDDMTPLVDSPPFIRALEELVAARQAGPTDIAGLDPQHVSRTFWSGGCALALTWTSAAWAGDADPAGRIAAGFCELPGATEVYHPSEGRFESVGRLGETRRATLLAVAGRQGSVAHAARHPEAALALLTALCGQEWSAQIAPASPACGMFRRQHIKSPRAWTGRAVDPAAAQQYAAVVESSLSRAEVLAAPQIPGREEYLAALDEAVAAALAGTPATEALRAAAARWREITARLGVESQRRAYEHSLGRRRNANQTRTSFPHGCKLGVHFRAPTGRDSTAQGTSPGTRW